VGVPGTTATPTFIAERCRVSLRYACYRIGAYTHCTCFVLVSKTINDFRVSPTDAIPACLTFRANSAFSDKKLQLQRHSIRTPHNIRSRGYSEWIISTPCSRAILLMSFWARYAPTGVRPILTCYASSACQACEAGFMRDDWDRTLHRLAVG
jgi:hypothetical protein